MGIRSSVCAAGLAFVACAPEQQLELIIDAPEGVLYVGAMLIGSSGIPHGTGLTRYERGTASLLSPVEIDNVTRVWVVGYTALDLANLDLPTEDVLGGARLRLATRVDPRLPSPSFSGSAPFVIGEPVKSLSALSTPPLTVDWLPNCPVLFPPDVDVFASYSCISYYCEVSGLQKDCDLRLTTYCGLEDVVGTVLGDGSIEVESRGVFTDCDSVRTVDAAAFALQCDSCLIEPYAEVLGGPVHVDAIQVLDVDPVRLRNAFAPWTGYLGGMFIREETVLVVDFGGALVEDVCDLSESSNVRFYDATSLTLVDTASAPPCLSRLVADPHGAGYLAAFGTDPLELGRFDEQAELVASSTVSVRGTGAHSLGGVVVIPERNLVAVGYRRQYPVGAQIVFFDSASLMELARVSVAARDILSMAVEEDRLLVGTDPGAALQAIDLTTNDFTVGPPMVTRLGVETAKGAHHMLAHAPSGNLVMSSAGTFPAINVLRNLEGLGHDIFFEASADVFATHEWPVDRNLVLASVANRDQPYTSRVALFDPELIRFIPGSTIIGSGAGSEIHEDAQGRLWVLLPWSGHVARLTPN